MEMGILKKMTIGSIGLKEENCDWFVDEPLQKTQSFLNQIKFESHHKKTE